MSSSDLTSARSLVQSHRDLLVYQTAFDLAMRIFKMSEKWPDKEYRGLTNQVRRSSRSVCSNIAEAWRKRHYPKHFASKLTDAQSECAETETWLEFAAACGYLYEGDKATCFSTTNHIIAMLTKMITNPKDWYI